MSGILIAILVGALVAAKIAGRRRTVVVPVRRTRYAASYPVVTPARSGRPHLWGVVIALLVLAVATYRFRGAASQQAATIEGPNQGWGLQAQATEAIGPMIPTPPNVPPPNVPPPVVMQTPQRKRGNYLKPPPVNPPPKWQADIVCTHALSVPENESTVVVRDVAERLTKDLRLQTVPRADFVAASTWVHITETGRDPVQRDPDIGEYVPVHYHAELTAEGWQHLGKVERASRAEERLGFAARGLGLMTVLLGAIAGFVRLDEWSKGYYSGRLFLVAAAVVAGAGWLIVSV
jgi:hypothetical protein